jgi:preprotein translocase subunit SecF
MKLPVIQQRTIWWSLSSVMILAGILAMVISWTQIGAPLRPSLDFVGGTRLQLGLDCTQAGNCDRPIDLADIRKATADLGLGDSSIQVLSGRDSQGEQRETLSIRTKTLTEAQRTQLKAALNKVRAFDPNKTQDDTVGPAIGQELLSSGLLALIISFALIIAYLSVRFQFDYAFFAIVALFHDVLITVGVFAALGLVLQTEVDSLFIVSLLTIVGFSVNDTVVIYDRIREVIKLNPDRHINDIVDQAVNQTLTRSINTTLTVLLTLFSIFFFGGETLKNFALALIIGFTMGAYSSIFIASTLLAWWRVRSGQVFGTPNPAQEDLPDAALGIKDS